MDNIEHATAYDIFSLSKNMLLTNVDAIVLENALLTVEYIKLIRSKAERSEDKEMVTMCNDFLRHGNDET